MNKQKQAFTLVELIVVITILAILWTIAFISLQWYSRSSRDSVRISDISSMKTSLELFYLDGGKYPETTNWTQITYSGSLNAWKQWIFWEDTFANVGKLDQIPTDPLTDKNYIYSVTNTKQEYELAWIFEWDEIAIEINDTYAAQKTAKAYVSWKYNWKILKITNWNTIYILAVPTLISWDISLATIEELITQWKLIFHWYSNLPSNYRDSNYDADAEWLLTLVNDWVYEVFSGTLDDLKIEATQIDLITNLQAAYLGTDLVNEYGIEKILSYDAWNDEGMLFLAQNIINQNVDSNIVITASETANPQYAPADFVTVWDVGIDAWITGLNNLLLPLDSLWTFNFSVDWWDWTSDTISSWNQAEATHNYSNSWTYTVVMNWQIDWFGFTVWWAWVDDLDDWDKLLSVTQWWNSKIANWWNQFGNCENLTTFSLVDEADISLVTNMYSMFRNSTNFNWDISNWDTTNVSSMGYMFTDAANFNQNIGWWNTANVLTMGHMFERDYRFNWAIGAWNTTKVADIQSMFYLATDFNQDLNLWDTSNVLNMTYTFSNTNFNWNISNWDTNKVTNFANIFYNNPVFNQDISLWDTSSALNMNSMFREADNFNSPLTTSWAIWDTSGVTNMDYMFNKAYAFDQDISLWNTANVDTMIWMFQTASSFNSPLTTSWAIWDTSWVTNMNYIFANASLYNQDLSSWNTGLVTSCVYFDVNANAWITTKPTFASCTP